MSTVNLQEARRLSYQHIEPKISNLQIKVLKGIQTFYRTQVSNPRYKELAEFLGLDRITVSSRLVELRKKGYVMSVLGSRNKKDGTKQLLTNKGAAKLRELGL